jgi:Tetratricopeptide repeat
MAREQGEVDEAIRYCEESLALCRDLELLYPTGWVLYNLGRAVLATGDLARAELLLIEGLQQTQRAGHRMGMSRGSARWREWRVARERRGGQRCYSEQRRLTWKPSRPTFPR